MKFCHNISYTKNAAKVIKVIDKTLKKTNDEIEKFQLSTCRLQYVVYRKMLVVQMIRTVAWWRRLALMPVVIKSGLYNVYDTLSMFYRITKT